MRTCNDNQYIANKLFRQYWRTLAVLMKSSHWSLNKVKLELFNIQALFQLRGRYLIKFGFLRLVFPENMNTESISGSELVITMLTLVDHWDMPGLHMTPHNMFSNMFILTLHTLERGLLILSDHTNYFWVDLVKL